MRERNWVFGRRLLWLTVAVWLANTLPTFAQQVELLPAVSQQSDPWRSYPTSPGVAVYPAHSATGISATGISATGTSARLAATPRDLSEPIVLDEQFPTDTAPAAPDGVLQRLFFTGTWLPAAGGDLGMSDLELGATLGFPLPTRESPLLISPYFATHFLDGPASPDLPARLYDASVQFRWLRPVGERWTADLAVSPGVHSDFESGDSEMFRITGHGLGIYQWSPTMKLILGIVVLDRDDVSLLPAGGILWTPNDAWRLELMAPRPRVARRILPCYGDACNEYWAYVAGEFGGGSWSIQRASGAQDVVMVRDYRVILGIERKSPPGSGRLKGRVEVGYVFAREVEYRSATPDFEPDDTLMLRIGASY